MIEYPGPYAVGISQIEIPATPDDYGLLGSIFYPATRSDAVAKSKWLLGPPSFYAMGYGDYGKFPYWFNKLLSHPLNAIRMPALKDAPPAIIEGKFPVAIFCHGLAGNQTTYSTFCGSLASHGIVVLSIEHRDGSASITGKNNYAETIKYFPYPEPLEEARILRQTQLAQRVIEVKTAYFLLETLATSTTPTPNLIPSMQTPLFTDKLDMTTAILIGHSFGGATALTVLQDTTWAPFTAGVILDPWMWPMPSFSAISVPIICINSETFHWRKNIAEFRQVWDKYSPATASRNKFAVVKSTGHQDVSDLPSFVYGTAKFFTKMGQPPHIVMAAYDVSVSKWISTILGGQNKILADIRNKSNKKNRVDEDIILYDDDAFGLLDKVMREDWK
ncbi:Platelet-activating factor acetylhydrolase [Physocladia obscura]|uniref:1-alkyl-2-acetylglycerophosphocholine esterase n=1 Tax=Physocladia obscura TaxID=109957 RepID=A0AAD5T471_9FUNG|nr:Platelet-activating factor acetylhydrolase [Physocladia obscura]